MVSNLDTRDICPLKDENEKVLNQSRDEIIDFLVGSTVDDSSEEPNKHCFELLRKDVAKSSSKVVKLQKLKLKKKKKNSSNYIKLLLLKLMVFRKNFTTFTVRILTQAVSESVSKRNKKHKLCLEKNNLKTKTFQFKASNILNTANTVISKTKPLIRILKASSINTYTKTKSLLAQHTNNLDGSILEKYPGYRQTVISAILLTACSLLAFINTTSTSLANAKKNSITTKKLSSVNWNVSNHISDNEKNYLMNLIKTGQIKVTNTQENNLKILSEKTRLAGNGFNPSATFMMIGSNVFSHSVSKGETILSISKKYKVSISDLITCNSDVDLINLKSGEKISIPKTAETKNIDSISTSQTYSKFPKFLLASRSMSGLGRFYPIETNSASTPNNMLWPVPASKTISSKYGPRGGGFHPGIDISAATGTAIISTRPGIVISSGWSGGYGKCIIIDHGNGISTRYAHASSLLVSPGQRIKAGQVIAKVGSTGWSTGAHLHYEVLVNGRHTNPMGYL